METLIIALKINDQEAYDRYREALRPLMQRSGVKVAKEYLVGEALHSQAPDESVNRVAMFSFTDAGTKAAFFSDPDYERAREHLAGAVENVERWVG